MFEKFDKIAHSTNYEKIMRDTQKMFYSKCFYAIIIAGMAINFGNVSFGQILKNLRITSGITQKNLGDAFHIKASTVSRWENGKNEPEYNMLKKLAEFFGTDIDSLLGYDASQNSIYLLSEDEIKLIVKYREIEENSKIKLLGYLDALK